MGKMAMLVEPIHIDPPLGANKKAPYSVVSRSKRKTIYKGVMGV
jgi:hypothetical protein